MGICRCERERLKEIYHIDGIQKFTKANPIQVARAALQVFVDQVAQLATVGAQASVTVWRNNKCNGALGHSGVESASYGCIIQISYGRRGYRFRCYRGRNFLGFCSGHRNVGQADHDDARMED